MQKITPHLWFDQEAKEAAEFYTSVFPKSKIKDTTPLHNTPSGIVDIVTALKAQREHHAEEEEEVMKMRVVLCMTDVLMVLCAETINILHGDTKL
jgi:predicted 3-demethylubiquinone-9 3-methyltransferase (glyoxalase superfamily)